VSTVMTKDLAESVTAPGQLTVSEDQTWRVGAVVAGKVDALTVKVGDFVKAGQIIGRIHSHDVHEARAAYQQASTELERARAAEAYSRQRRDRAARLLELKAGSRQDVETAESELRNAQAAIDKAQSEIAKERAHLTDILHVPIDDRSSVETEDGVPIFAPASGVVQQRKATVGSVVNAGDELLSLSDTRSLWMIAGANETELSKLHPGLAVRIEVRAYPDREFNGHILKLGEQLDPTTRTLQIRIGVPNPQGLLKPEMYATASLPEGGKRAVLVLPEEAVQDINGIPAVFVRKSATEFEPRTIKTGRHANGETEITEGLKPGEDVVVKGSFLLKSQLMRRAIEE
ncbi:MAG TPA: efflux RND transporter periplasmic adaptor subunit, partial [Nitrospiraceae bacterium]|nr:efflux RND transporter periplasmic adaptor subunit [Nitrospiraceae bacterium]